MMIIKMTEIPTDLYGLIGLTIGGFFGVILAIIKEVGNKRKTIKEDLEETKVIREELEELKGAFKSLKTAFTLVFNEMERKGELPQQMKDFKQMFKL